MEKALCALKEAMASLPALALHEFYKRFVVETETLAVAVGAVLSGKERDEKVHSLQ